MRSHLEKTHKNKLLHYVTFLNNYKFTIYALINLRSFSIKIILIDKKRKESLVC